MRRQLAAIIRPFVMALLTLAAFVLPVRAEDNVRIQEEIWALPLPLPMFAYVVRPVGDGPFPLAITLVPLIVATLFAYYVLRMNPVVTCGALAGAMTVDAAVTGACEVAESQTPVLGVAVPYAMGNVVLTVLGPIIVAATYSG